MKGSDGMKDTGNVTRFQRTVYDTLRKVPKGKVTTYQDLALAVGVRSPRAIGQAMRRNPFAPEVPCHRVVRSDGTIGGFAGCAHGSEIGRKERLLAKEGVRVTDGRIEEFARRRHTFRA